MADYYFSPTYSISSIKEMKEQYVSPNTTTVFVNRGKNQIYTKYLEGGQQVCHYYQEIPEPKEVTVEDLTAVVLDLTKQIEELKGAKSNANEQSTIRSNDVTTATTRTTNANGLDELK